MEKTYDAAVIGAGLAGLIAAAKLAQAGKSVVVLEKSHRLGGRAITNLKNGSLFNLGGHALYLGGEAYSVMKEMGVKMEGGSPPINGYGIWNNRLVPLPVEPMKLLSSKLLGWTGKIQLVRLMTALRKYDGGSLPGISLREWTEREISDPMVRHFFYALCRTATYAADPDSQLAGPVLRQVHTSLKGVRYLHGGWQTLVDQLRDLAVRAGADIRTGKAAAEIIHDGSRIQGLRLADGDRLDVSHVIATSAPADLFRLVPGAERTVLRSWKEEARPAMTACLDLSLNRLPVEGRHFVMGLDRPVFFSHHSRVASLSEDGKQVVHLIKYNGPGESSPRADERILEETMDLIHPGWRKELAGRQFLPNITVVPDTFHTGRSSACAGPAVPGLSGLYAAGDWAGHREMLADASAASAVRAASAVLEALRAEQFVNGARETVAF
ncbi:phytoene desaturase family protein [Paenibacillus sp. 1P03SA]|uniref:phytoene desaturase family protein n=1 Tax=Paenibacillus sp. 1P03SA TaxID=3132294 RepID=UPI0039A1C799